MKKQNSEKTLSPSLFKDTINKLAVSLTRTEAKVDELSRKIDTELLTKKHFDIAMGHIDHFAGELKNYRNKAIMHDYRFNQLEPQVANHEKRLSLLEKKP